MEFLLVPEGPCALIFVWAAIEITFTDVNSEGCEEILEGS